MALDFLSAPGLIILHYYYYSFQYFMSIFLAPSVDPERAFSGSHLQVNHFQHQMALQCVVLLSDWVAMVAACVVMVPCW